MFLRKFFFPLQEPFQAAKKLSGGKLPNFVDYQKVKLVKYDSECASVFLKMPDKGRASLVPLSKSSSPTTPC